MTRSLELLDRYKQDRSEEAFQEIVRLHLDMVYAAALRQLNGNTHLAEDVAQTVFASLARKAHGLSRETILSAWLYRYASNTAKHVARSERRRRVREHNAAIMDELNVPTQPDESHWKELVSLIDNAVQRLRIQDRNAIILRFFEEFSFRQVGEELGVSEDAAQKRVSRAINKLRGHLARQGHQISGATLTAALATVGSLMPAPTDLMARVCQESIASTASGSALGMIGAWMVLHTKTLVIASGIVVCTGLGAWYQWQAKPRDVRIVSQAETPSLLGDRLTKASTTPRSDDALAAGEERQADEAGLDHQAADEKGAAIRRALERIMALHQQRIDEATARLDELQIQLDQGSLSGTARLEYAALMGSLERQIVEMKHRMSVLRDEWDAWLAAYAERSTDPEELEVEDDDTSARAKKHPIDFLALSPAVRHSARALYSEIPRNINEGRVDEAVEQAKELIALVPDNASVYSFLGAAYTKNREFDLAAETFDRALLFDPDDPLIHYNRAEIDFVQGNYKEAEERFLNVKSSVDSSTDMMTHWKVFLCQLCQDHFEDAAATANELMDGPINETLLSQAAIAYQRNSYDEAQVWIDEAMTSGDAQAQPVLLDALLEMGWAEATDDGYEIVKPSQTAEGFLSIGAP